MQPVSHEIRVMSRLALPVVVTQLGNMMLWVVDYIMVGAVGFEELGAVALGRLMIVATLMFGMGIVLGIDPVITQAHGARDPERISLAVQGGLILSVLVSPFVAVFWFFTEPVLVGLGQEPGLARLAHEYVLVQLPIIPMFLMFTVLRQYLQGREVVKPTMWVVLIANVVNILANWVLIFGKLGFPAMGAVGAGLATTFTGGFQLVLLFAWTWFGGLHRGAWTTWTRKAWEKARLLEIIRFGTPVGIQISLEMWAFTAASLFAGWLGTVELAAHTIVLNIASVSFMVPLGISFAAVTRVGNLIGAGRSREAQRAAWVAVAMGGGVMVVFAAMFIGARHWLPSFYAVDPAVIALSAVLLPVAAAFQLFDGIQVVGSGVLRGMGRTRPVAIFNLFGYWALALPLAYWLAFPMGMGVPGIWWGLCLGLGVVAVMVMVWIAVWGPGKVDARVV
jgi:MATE family multidrug resistance protein